MNATNLGPTANHLLRWPTLLLLLAALGHGGWQLTLRPAALHRFLPPVAVAGPPGSARLESFAVSHDLVPSVHSASLVELADGALQAFWFGGTREGHRDVRIFSSRFDTQEQRWSREEALFTRAQTQRDLQRYVKKLGNPAVGRHPDGRLWLFYVSVSVGGWAGSAINLSLSPDEGRSWSTPRRLITSPFMNLSTLVRARPQFFSDGSAALPVYHEMAAKFGELLYLDSKGHVVDKRRMAPGRVSLQPELIPRGGLQAVAFLRNAGAKPRWLWRTQSEDGGRSWAPLEPSQLPNPDAGFGILRLAGGELLSAHNHSESGRENLTLAVSRDEGLSWQLLTELESPARDEQGRAIHYEYPQLLQDRRGDIHLIYTWGRKLIKHQGFNRAWLEKQGL